MAEKPVIHGRDHRGLHPLGGKGPDPARLYIDSTANVGDDQGVHSYGADSGDALVSDGSGGTEWAAVSGSSGIHYGNNVPVGSPGWLDIQTTEDDGSLAAWGFKLDVVTGNAQLRVENGYLDIQTGANNQDITLTVGASSDLTMSIDNTAGSVFVVKTLAFNRIFEVRGDGSVHGLASVGSITWDL